jgi:uncharacterized protein
MDEMQNRLCSNLGKVDEYTISCILDKVFAYEKQAVSFVFQGGEPTLAGIDFYRRFLNLLREKNRNKILVYLALQTNGYDIDKDWARFLSDNQFLVGLSLDGISETHDRFRRSRDESETFEQVIKAAKLLQEANCQFNILTVITKPIVESIDRIYKYYQKQGFFYQQYIPCMDGLGEMRGKNSYSLLPEDYGVFLKNLFDFYKKDMLSGRYIFIRRFDNWCAMVGGQEPEECCLSGRCSPQLIIEANGDVFPCDFYAIDRLLMGNIKENNVQELLNSEAAERFFRPVELSKECKKCQWLNLCRGGCPREGKGDFNGAENYYCKALKDFFAYAYEDMVKIWNLYKY